MTAKNGYITHFGNMLNSVLPVHHREARAFLYMSVECLPIKKGKVVGEARGTQQEAENRRREVLGRGGSGSNGACQMRSPLAVTFLSP